MKANLWAGSLAFLCARLVFAEGPSVADLMAQGKLDADMGNHLRAAEAFEGVARRSDAPEALRWEALVRKGLTLRASGEYERSIGAFDEVRKSYGKNAEALRFLIVSVSGAVPGPARWAEVWPKVALEVDRTNPSRPTLAVRWPGAALPGARRYAGNAVDLDFKDGDLQDVFRLFADVSGLNVVVYPGVQGAITFAGKDVPWDEALDRMLAPNGLGYALEGNVLRIARFEQLGASRTFAGAPLDVDFQGESLAKVLGFLAQKGGLRVNLDPDVSGKIHLKLNRVPWDQALDLVARTNALEWKREGSVIRVFRPTPGKS